MFDCDRRVCKLLLSEFPPDTRSRFTLLWVTAAQIMTKLLRESYPSLLIRSAPSERFIDPTQWKKSRGMSEGVAVVYGRLREDKEERPERVG